MANSLHLYTFFKAKGYIDNIDSAKINTSDYYIAQKASLTDKDAFFLNGILTFASMLNSLRKQNYSWSFVKAYYCIFYLARTFNAINNYSIVYANSKPYRIKIQPEERFTKLKGNSHEVVLNLYRDEFASDNLLNNEIEEMNPIDWFKINRELINYRLNPLTDPNPPIDLFNYRKDIRKWLYTYFNDSTDIYTFSKEHSYVAYPIKLISRILDYYEENEQKNVFFNDDIILHLRSNISDSKGPITFIINKFENLIE
jgi:hypothetical protein